VRSATAALATPHRFRLAICLVGTLACLAGCGSSGSGGGRISGRTLTIYMSSPLHGASSVEGRAAVEGAQLALSEVRGRVGKYRIRLRSLDDSTPQRGGWDPGQTTLNARAAVQDQTTIGYIGELNSGASAISIPLLNRVGIAQISPTSTAVGLTSAGLAASPGEPEKYYPSGVRTFARVIPNDSVQAAVQVRLQKAMGCRKAYVLDDGEVDGEDTATSYELAAQAAHLTVIGVQPFDPRATDYSSLATAVAQTGPDCIMLSAITESNAVLLTKQLGAAVPGATIFGDAGLAETTYTDPGQGGIPVSLDPRVLITSATLDLSAYPPSGRAFFAAFERRFGAPEPDAIFGYEAMSLMLDAISRATHRGTTAAVRSRVVSAIFGTRDRHSVLGAYSIDPNGDTTLRRYGVYRLVDGKLAFWDAIGG
jgi:branched-chain amino acid transport system substrate-binding protein